MTNLFGRQFSNQINIQKNKIKKNQQALGQSHSKNINVIFQSNIDY